MDKFLALWKRELLAYFYSPIAYVVGAFFFFLFGYSFWLFTNNLTTGLSNITLLSDLFSSVFFWLALLVTTPLLTMRLFAEEKRTGTIEALMTAPVPVGLVVAAKYAAVLAFFAMLWIPTPIYILVLAKTTHTHLIDFGTLASCYLGTFLHGAFYLAIGLITSSLCKNQIVAAVASLAILTIIFLTGLFPYLHLSSRIWAISAYTSPLFHMVDFARGQVDSRPIIFYLSSTWLLLLGTTKIIEAYRWK